MCIRDRLSGATDPGGATDVDRRPGRPPIVLPLALPGRVAGRPYPPEAVRRRLAEVGCAVEGTDPLTVTPPSWRPDLGQAAPLVELGSPRRRGDCQRIRAFDGAADFGQSTAYRLGRVGASGDPARQSQRKHYRRPTGAAVHVGGCLLYTSP